MPVMYLRSLCLALGMVGAAMIVSDQYWPGLVFLALALAMPFAPTLWIKVNELFQSKDQDDKSEENWYSHFDKIER